MLPPLKAKGYAPGAVGIQIWAPDPGAARWEEAMWDSGTWMAYGWRVITPQAMAVRITWGADDPTGVLTIPAAGSWVINTYDPQRLLDPSNGQSPYATAIRPGKPISVYYKTVTDFAMVRQGVIDEVEYDIDTQRGVLRGTDMVQFMVNAILPAGQTGAPTTLRARAVWAINKAGLGSLIPVEPVPDGDTDPPVGPVVATEAPVWTHILTAALDALYAVWMDRLGVLRFRSFGNPRDVGLTIGGPDGIPIRNLKAAGTLQGVFTHIIGFNASAPTVAVEAIDVEKKLAYGDIALKRDQPVPDARIWVDSVLADRAGASLQYSPGTLYPRTLEELESILDLGMIDIAHVSVPSANPDIDIAPRVLGGTIIADTGTGWTAELTTYIPATEWDEAELPVPPIIPPVIPPTTTDATRTYTCAKDTRLAHSGSLDAGNGTDVQLPIGYINGYRNRAILGFASIPFTDVVEVTKAELMVVIGTNSCGAFGSDPKVVVSRLTGSFSEGTYAATCGFGTSNASKYPGPAITSSGAVTVAVPSGTGSTKSIDITAIARAWFSGQPQHGLMVKSAGEDSSKYTTCFYSRHHGTSGNRPFLRLTLKVKV